MTGSPDFSLARDNNDARDFHREQLSAMMDGELSADETKFLLRRMEHDDALADCWQRWQFAGDALRGQVDRALPADFSRRVGRAIADDIAAAESAHAATAQAHARGPLMRWGGGAALAASVALAALIGTRMLSVPGGATSAAATASTTTPSPSPSASIPVPAVAGVAPKPIAPRGTGSSASLIAEAGAAVALAAVSSGERRGSRPRILARDEAIAASNAATAKAVASASLASAARATRSASAAAPRQDEIAATQTVIIAKPWPRALVPGAGMNGEVTAGFEGAPVFHPFEPRIDPQAPRSAEDAAPSP